MNPTEVTRGKKKASFRKEEVKRQKHSGEEMGGGADPFSGL